jgi:hypothetical protein
LIAIKILRKTDEDNPGHKGLLLLTNILVAGFNPFQGSPPRITREISHVLDWAVQKRGGYEKQLTSLELAILSEAKLLLAFPTTQKVVESIYKGKVVYTPVSFVDILPDHYKRHHISLYDPRSAPLLDQYRLIVPRIRNTMEISEFVVLLVLYLLAMINRQETSFTGYEIIFCVYAGGWVLDQVASMLEHGFGVYTQNLWAFLDVSFAVIYGIYLVLRLRGLSAGQDSISILALDLLATGAAVLMPRLAFNVMSENMLFLSLRAMMADFAVLTLLAVWCFAGFLLGLTLMGPGIHRPITISKWMLWVWFGLDGTGIQRSVDFHWLFGPILMISFAFLGNTLFLTILVSMLSNTFSVIASNATAEKQFRRAVLTFEGVKSDAIFAYPPPFNILALLTVFPLQFVVSPRWFHKINVYAVRTINAPVLFLIGFLERRFLWTGIERLPGTPTRSHSTLNFWDLSRFSMHSDISTVFDVEPLEEDLDNIPISDQRRQNVLVDAFQVTNQSLQEHLKSRVEDKQKSPDRSVDSSGGGSNLSAVRKPDDLERRLSCLEESNLSAVRKPEDLEHRLSALEESTKRIEQMLMKLSQVVDYNSDDDDGSFATNDPEGIERVS